MELIAALLHRPRVLFLDEPTIGLDVVSQKAVRQFLRDYNRRHNVTILLTSHYMADIQELCDRVIVIHRGAKIYDGALDRLEARSGTRRKIIKFLPQPGAFPENWTSRHGQVTRDEDSHINLSVPATEIIAVSQEILTAGSVADITIEDVPLEDIIADLFTSR
jgi:ABC-2 type transport system ATP-binding protein